MESLPGYVQDLLANQGPKVLTWILAILGIGGARLLVLVTSNKMAADAARMLALHARDAIQATYQTYVEALKLGRSDGSLSPAEAAEAKARAIAILKDRLGWKRLAKLGGGVLANIFLGDKWDAKVEKMLGTAVEVAVADEKKLGKAMGLSTQTATATATSASGETATVSVPL